MDADPETLQAIGLWSAFSITPRPCVLAEALAGTARNLEAMGFSGGDVIGEVMWATNSTFTFKLHCFTFFIIDYEPEVDIFAQN